MLEFNKKSFNLINNVFGWLSFVIAAVVYLMTIEPTASFWDCGEFITSAFKLEVGHPPGAPFFMLTGNFFSLFASDTTQVAKMVNSMSAIMSALTILFLFWTITHLAKRLIYTDSSKPMEFGQLCAIIGSGLVGAMAYTFSDTFWFSAVEAEVYAYSSMFTALVFWLILKWENRADQEGSDKWIVLIAYVMGLSIGVHLLNLLCIPAIVLIYYYKKSKNVSLKGVTLALLGSMGLIIALMYGIIPGFTKVGGWFELYFVNDLGLSYNTGAFFYLALLFIAIIWGLFETLSSKGSFLRAKVSYIVSMTLSGVVFIGGSPFVWLLIFAAMLWFCFKSSRITFRMVNTSMLCLLFILIGYSSFALIPIRSAANTPMDQNSPEDVFSLADYLNREQYGDNPLFYGRTYASKPIELASEKEKYDKVVKTTEGEDDKYFVANTSPTYKYTNEMLLPRMYSNEARHIQGYKKWGGITNENIPPSFIENIRYMFSYQINFMYWRYFMWNFAGRQNDIQNMGGISNGNWMTGISFIDEHFLGLGPQDELPPHITENKGHNVYYLLPLLLGIIGIFFQLCRGKEGERQMWVTFILFFMTGLAIVLYLNQKPFEPRERDYAYAGSFYAYCIWIGLGVAGLWTFLKRYISSDIAAPVVTVLALIVPIQMASQNWDDHDRSNRYTMRDFGKNYLRSVAPNGIIFTYGDNDTFPLWYAQEVEGFRTDVRVTNLSYLATDWYVDQMRRDSYDSPALPIDWDKSMYIGEKGQMAYVLTQNSDTINLADVMPLLKGDNSQLLSSLNIKEDILLVPTTKLMLEVDSTKVDWKSLGSSPSSTNMIIDLGDKGHLFRNDLMILEMLNNINKDDWKRPIYFARTVPSSSYLNMQDNFLLEGLTYRIAPGNTGDTGVNTEVTFNNLMNEFEWGGIENPKVYLDENNMRMILSFRITFIELIQALIEEGKTDKALQALDYCMEVIPPSTIPLRAEGVILAEAYFALGEPQKGEELLSQINDRARKELNWYHRLKPDQLVGEAPNIHENYDILLRSATTYQKTGNTEKYKALIKELQNHIPLYFNSGSKALGNYALQNIFNVSVGGLQSGRNPEAEREVLNETGVLMKKHNPDMYKEYFQ